jgi:single-stranded DNA-binding protein
MFRVAVWGRREWQPSYFTAAVWRDQAKHASQSLSKGSRVVVVGRLQQRSWAAEDGSARAGLRGAWRARTPSSTSPTRRKKRHESCVVVLLPSSA